MNEQHRSTVGTTKGTSPTTHPVECSGFHAPWLRCRTPPCCSRQPTPAPRVNDRFAWLISCVPGISCISSCSFRSCISFKAYISFIPPIPTFSPGLPFVYLVGFVVSSVSARSSSISQALKRNQGLEPVNGHNPSLGLNLLGDDLEGQRGYLLEFRRLAPTRD